MFSKESNYDWDGGRRRNENFLFSPRKLVKNLKPSKDGWDTMGLWVVKLFFFSYRLSFLMVGQAEGGEPRARDSFCCQNYQAALRELQPHPRRKIDLVS